MTRIAPWLALFGSLAALGAEPVGNTLEEFAAMIKVETAKWTRIVKDADIEVE